MADLESFRREIHDWLEKNAPKGAYLPWKTMDELCWGGRKVSYSPEILEWLRVAAERGITAPTWPREYGGGGMTNAEAKILSEEMGKLGLRPPLLGFGLHMIGPLLLQMGSEEQKKKHIPPIVHGEVRWCQGYSEPGSGSDLASVQTRAVADGDDYVVDGQKIWTSYADKADWMFLLVRTDPEAPKHRGITFLLMDMDSPGVTTRPIQLISGSSPFCETFMTEVRVPRANVVGKVNEGWAIAKALLGFERNMIADMFKPPRREVRAKGDPIAEIARRHVGEENGRLADPLIRDRIVQADFDQKCLELTMARSADAAKAGHAPGPESSIFKFYGTELNKRRQELLMSILGPQGLGWEGPGFDERELLVTREWLRSRANSIEGGTTEIQLNIIAKRVLGLPD